MYNLIAKSNPRQTIRQHTDLVLKDFDNILILYKDLFTEKEIELIKIACEHHDYGKAIYNFQINEKINNENCLCNIEVTTKKQIIEFYKTIKNLGNIPHGYISPAFLNIRNLKEIYGEESTNNLLNAIYYHHNRNSNCTHQDLIKIIKSDINVRFPNIYTQTAYLNSISGQKETNKDDNYEENWVRYAIIKGILNRCDYHASSNISTDIEISPYIDNKNISDLVKRTIISKYEKLRNVQQYMLEHNKENLIVTASTGIGKTEAALLWADKNKTFYTLPLKVSINAIYERIKNEYNYGERTILMHSDAITYLMNNEENKKYNQLQFFSYPLTVCTIDQLFSFVYKYNGCEQLLATLKYSKIIIDEIQAYSPQLVAKIIYGLKLITLAGGKFAIITATMPPIFEYFLNKSLKKVEIKYCKPEKTFFSDKIRHFISYSKSEFNFEIIKEHATNKKVLVICNTVKNAQKAYEILSKENENNNVQLLHSHFTKRDRLLLEKSILDFSKNNAYGIWISTQIVEASLDIDFDILFTEMATADSLLQRMGRCYRKRVYNKNEPNIIICDNENGKNYIYDEEIYARSVEFIVNYNNNYFSEEQKEQYIQKVYSVEDLKHSNFSKQIRKELDNCESAMKGNYSKEDAMHNLRNILAVNVIPESVYIKANKNGEIDNCLNTIDNHSSTLKEKLIAEQAINDLTISINKYSQIAKLKDLLPINKNSKFYIYRIQVEYNFNEKELTGVGLINNFQSDNVL